MVTKKSYPTSKVRGSGRECQAVTAQEQPRGATPRLRSGAAAGRSYPTSEVRGSGWQELPHVRGQGRQPRGATPCPRLGVVAERSYATSEARGVAGRIYPMPEAAARRSNPTSKERWMRGRRWA